MVGLGPCLMKEKYEIDFTPRQNEKKKILDKSINK